LMVLSDCFVSIVAPLQDDEDIVGSFVDDVLSMLADAYAHYELVLVDDGSTDETVPRVAALLTKHQHVRLIRLSRRFGQEIAISAGLDSVIGDFAVVMLPATDPPELVPEMVERARAGAHVFFGIRRERAEEPFLLQVGARFFYWCANRILRLDIPKDTTHFRVLSRQVVNALMQLRDHGRYLQTLSQHVGYGSQSFVYDLVRRRKKPRTKTLLEAVDLAINIICTNSLQPLRLVGLLGFAMAAVNALYMLYIVGIFLFKENVAEGWVTQSAQNAGMFFFLFMILAVLCEYLGRLLAESKGRPLYYVMDEMNSSAEPLDEGRKNIVTDSVDA